MRAARSAGLHLLLSVGAFSAAVNLLNLTGPLFMMQVYDRVLGSRSVPTLAALFALVAGVVDGRNVWRTDLPGALDLLEELTEAGARVRVGTSTSLLHVPHDLEAETALPGHARNRLAFADQKVQEVLILARGLAEGREAIAEELARRLREAGRGVGPVRPTIHIGAPTT